MGKGEKMAIVKRPPLHLPDLAAPYEHQIHLALTNAGIISPFITQTYGGNQTNYVGTGLEKSCHIVLYVRDESIKQPKTPRRYSVDLFFEKGTLMPVEIKLLNP